MAMETKQIAIYSVVAAILVAAPFFVQPVFIMTALCFALFACSCNLLVGYAGLLSFGHAAYFGIGSYVAAWVVTNLGWSTELSIGAATASVIIIGAFFGWLAIKQSGIYFSMITLALGQMVYFLCLQLPVTGGEDGIQHVVRTPLLGIIDVRSDNRFYVVVAILFVIVFSLIARIINSPFGNILKGIRENEARMMSLGYVPDRYKLIAFVLSAGIAGLAGGTKALVIGLATLTDVNFMMSGLVVIMILLGGLGTLLGPVVGAIILIAMNNYLAPLGAWVTFIQGSILLACVLVFRSGIVGEIQSKLRISL